MKRIGYFISRGRPRIFKESCSLLRKWNIPSKGRVNDIVDRIELSGLGTELDPKRILKFKPPYPQPLPPPPRPPPKNIKVLLQIKSVRVLLSFLSFLSMSVSFRSETTSVEPLELRTIRPTDPSPTSTRVWPTGPDPTGSGVSPPGPLSRHDSTRTEENVQTEHQTKTFSFGDYTSGSGETGGKYNIRVPPEK